MSKQKVKLALERAAAGDLAGARGALKDVSVGFVRKRLDHYIRHGEKTTQRPAAEVLWKELFPSPLHSEEVARLSAPVRDTAPALDEQPAPARVELDAPDPFLRWLTHPRPDAALSLDEAGYVEVWGLVGLAALLLPERVQRPLVRSNKGSSVARFAHAVGFDAITSGQQPVARLEEARTVRLRRVPRYSDIETTGEDISRLIAPTADAEEMRRTIKYVLIELLRNVIQHSEDPQGGVAAAQLMNVGSYSRRPMIQVAVADAGIGVPAHVRRMHSGLEDPRVALERALWPHISGTFPQGLTGSRDNAGLGLFFIAEMAKRTDGRLMIASRGATLMLASGQGHDEDRVVPRFLQPPGIGFPGTLVVFEIPVDAVKSYAAMNREILESARARTPARAVHHWVRFELPAGNVDTIRVRELREDTSRAAGVAKDKLRRAVVEGRRVVLDFASIEVCTQSFLHALLYESVRLAWALRSPIYIINADAPVRSGIEFLESYALGG